MTLSGRGGLEVEQWIDNFPLSISAEVRIPSTSINSPDYTRKKYIIVAIPIAGDRPMAMIVNREEGEEEETLFPPHRWRDVQQIPSRKTWMLHGVPSVSGEWRLLFSTVAEGWKVVITALDALDASMDIYR